MKQVLGVLICILAVTLTASAQSSFFYPHVLNGNLGNVVWRTTIFITNNASAGTATGAITFTQDNSDPTAAGSAWPISLSDESGFFTNSSTVTFVLPPGGIKKLVSAPTGIGGLVSGFANVTTNSGTVSGTAIFSEFDSEGNLLGEAGVPAVAPVTKQSIFVDSLNKYSVGVAFANPGMTAAAITLSLVSNTGAAVTTPVTRQLGSGNHTQTFTSQLFPSVTQPMVGTMQISSNTPLIAIALRFDPTLSKFTTLPPVTLSALLYGGLKWLLERHSLFVLASFGRLGWS